MPLTFDEIRHPGLSRKRWRYYLIGEVDEHLLRVASRIEEERGAYIEARLKSDTLSRENEERARIIAALETRVAEQEKIIASQAREINDLSAQFSRARTEGAELSEQMTQRDADLIRLKKRAERLAEQLTTAESQNADAIIEDAVRKAEKIVSRAVAESDEMLMKVNEQRGRLVAACRAAYYNALQFKQDLADQFRRMGQELDASIDVLQGLDNTRITMNNVTTVTGPDGSGAKK